jgi:hypothetical protein
VRPHPNKRAATILAQVNQEMAQIKSTITRQDAGELFLFCHPVFNNFLQYNAYQHQPVSQ